MAVLYSTDLCYFVETNFQVLRRTPDLSAATPTCMYRARPIQTRPYASKANECSFAILTIRDPVMGKRTAEMPISDSATTYFQHTFLDMRFICSNASTRDHRYFSSRGDLPSCTLRSVSDNCSDLFERITGTGSSAFRKDTTTYFEAGSCQAPSPDRFI